MLSASQLSDLENRVKGETVSGKIAHFLDCAKTEGYKQKLDYKVDTNVTSSTPEITSSATSSQL